MYIEGGEHTYIIITVDACNRISIYRIEDVEWYHQTWQDHRSRGTRTTQWPWKIQVMPIGLWVLQKAPQFFFLFLRYSNKTFRIWEKTQPVVRGGVFEGRLVVEGGTKYKGGPPLTWYIICEKERVDSEMFFSLLPGSRRRKHLVLQCQLQYTNVLESEN